nr:MAG TPA: hypothetical protein [Caudoviricetes sp.]
MILIALSSNARGFLLLGINKHFPPNYKLSLNGLGFFITSRGQLLTK